MSYTIAIARPPSTYDGRTTTGNPISAATAWACSGDVAVPLARLRNAEVPQEPGEALPVFGQVDRVRRRAENPDAGRLQPQRELQRRLAAVLHHAGDVAAGGLLALDDGEHVLERQRLEVEPIDGVVVGRHRLRVAVHHDRLVAAVAQGERRVTAAVVELDALADPVRSAAENDDLRPTRDSASHSVSKVPYMYGVKDSNSAAQVSMRL